MDLTQPIGVFDSGVGGLTVVRAIRKGLPHETLRYLGDTARVPYGTKSADVVRRYAINCSRFLVDAGAKILVIACNTASAYAVDAVREHFALPVVGVVEPGARLAAATTQNGCIGIIGTEGTIKSASYQRALTRLAPQAEVHTLACPLFVPLAEEGMVDHLATKMIAEEYLRPLLAKGIDTLVLGCTHYPLLAPVLRQVAGDKVAIVDSATAVADAVRITLNEAGLAATERMGEDMYYATDVSERVLRVGSLFLGDGLHHVELVDL